MAGFGKQLTEFVFGMACVAAVAVILLYYIGRIMLACGT